MPDAHRAVDAVWRMESARIVAGLVRMVGDVGLAEELAQDALLAALEQWPESGVPDNPGAWLMAVAKRRAVDHLRRGERLDVRHEQLAHEIRTQEDAPEPLDDEVDDDVLRLMFVSCHPALSAEARVALTLRLLGGLRTDEIARAFLVAEPTVAQRVVRAKRTLADLKVPFEVPSGPERAARLASVLEVVYLVFNEGYAATAGDDLVRQDLCIEALRLGRLLARLTPGDAEAHGLVALMELQASRTHARTDPSGAPVALHDQQRSRWDQLLIRRGFASLLRARQIGAPLGPYVLQAAIAACHAKARTADATDWAQIAALYAVLTQVLPTPIVQLNRAVAVAMADGPDAGLELIDALVGEPALADYHRLPAVRGDLLAQLGRHQEARQEFTRAAALTRNAPERAVLLDRAAMSAAAVAAVGNTLAAAAAAFLARNDLDTATLRSYGQTMSRLRRELDGDRALGSISAAQVGAVFTAAWGNAAAATWNRHRAALRSFVTWAHEPALAADVERRYEPRARTRPLERRQVEELGNRPDVAVRERTLWALVHESAAGIGAVLALDVDDLDLAGRRARTGRGWIRWGPGTAELLPRLIGARRRGPVFLSERRPGPGRPPAERDLCPETGRRRLSYARAEYLFKQATGHTLDQLRTRREPLMSAAIPAPVQRLLDAANAGDIDTFVAGFTPDGVVDDWGRTFHGPDGIRGWSDREFIGKQVSLSEVGVTRPGNPVTVRATVGGNGFNGPSHFAFDVQGDAVARMTITA